MSAVLSLDADLKAVEALLHKLDLVRDALPELLRSVASISAIPPDESTPHQTAVLQTHKALAALRQLAGNHAAVLSRAQASLDRDSSDVHVSHEKRPREASPAPAVPFEPTKDPPLSIDGLSAMLANSQGPDSQLETDVSALATRQTVLFRLKGIMQVLMRVQLQGKDRLPVISTIACYGLKETPSLHSQSTLAVFQVITSLFEHQMAHVSDRGNIEEALILLASYTSLFTAKCRRCHRSLDELRLPPAWRILTANHPPRFAEYHRSCYEATNLV